MPPPAVHTMCHMRKRGMVEITNGNVIDKTGLKCGPTYYEMTARRGP
jgi:hypothetical protein